MTQFKALRRDKGLTQQDVAALLGITRGAYANIENGKREPDFSVLFTLADYFNVSVDYLIGHEKKPTASSGELSKEEWRIVCAYRQADERARQVVDLTLEPFTEASSPSSRPAAAV